MSLGYTVATCLRTRRTLETLVSLTPFTAIQVTDEMRLAVTFFADSPGHVTPALSDTRWCLRSHRNDTKRSVFRVASDNGRPGRVLWVP